MRYPDIGAAGSGHVITSLEVTIFKVDPKVLPFAECLFLCDHLRERAGEGMVLGLVESSRPPPFNTKLAYRYFPRAHLSPYQYVRTP